MTGSEKYPEGQRTSQGTARLIQPAHGYDDKFGGTLENRTSGGGGTGWPLAKSLSLIPESFRWAMVYGRNPFTGRQTEPWRLRNVIRWVRPNPPVGALGDKFRPATSELMVFCKSAKRYFDLDAVREPVKPHTAKYEGQRGAGPKKGNADRADNGLIEYGNHPAGAPPLDWWNIPLLEGEEPSRMGPKPAYDPVKRNERNKGPGYPSTGFKGVTPTGTHAMPKSSAGNFVSNELGAPPLDWWEIPPGGYNGAHYAVMPAELCVKPIKAMSPERVCRVCGEPSRRITERTPEYAAARAAIGDFNQRDNGQGSSGSRSVLVAAAGKDITSAENVTVGWTDCGHDDWRPGLVLDCFGGSGTTALVATGHGRDCILIDLDERNFDLALERVGPFILSLGDDD